MKKKSSIFIMYLVCISFVLKANDTLIIILDKEQVQFNCDSVYKNFASTYLKNNKIVIYRYNYFYNRTLRDSTSNNKEVKYSFALSYPVLYYRGTNKKLQIRDIKNALAKMRIEYKQLSNKYTSISKQLHDEIENIMWASDLMIFEENRYQNKFLRLSAKTEIIELLKMEKAIKAKHKIYIAIVDHNKRKFITQRAFVIKLSPVNGDKLEF